MAVSTTYKIVLPKGEAPRRLFELNEIEIREIGLQIFRHVSQLAAEIGESPVILKTRSLRSRRVRHSA